MTADNPDTKPTGGRPIKARHGTVAWLLEGASLLQRILDFLIAKVEALRHYFASLTGTASKPLAMAPVQKPVIFIIGGPGSGKGTICDKIKAKYGFTHLSTGDLLREEVASGSDLGQALNAVMASGKLVSNEQVLELLAGAIEKRQAQATGFLIDGYPREVGQAIAFEAKVAPCSVCMYFNCSDAEMTARLLNRGKTSGRVDDNEETIKKRLDTFHAHSQPILDHYKPQGKLEILDTVRPVDAIFADVEVILDKLLAK